MKKNNISLSFDEYSSLAALNAEDKLLLESAITACDTAYAPYSKFRVGAAVLLENGIIVLGNNQENAAYPSGLCAERVALFAAGSQFPGVSIKKVAVAAFPENANLPKPVSPCGACRQVMAEYEHRYASDIGLIMISSGGTIIVTHRVSTLLPFLFNSESMH